MFAVAMPAFMPCEICPPGRTEEECAEFQRAHGCHACDHKGCWLENPLCEFYERPRKPEPDAQLGDRVPHMRETRITCTADGTNVEGRLRVNWWQNYTDVRFGINEEAEFSMGHASGEQCNCLIDTLRARAFVFCTVL